MNTLDANKQLCRDYFRAFLARDTGWMARHIAPDFVRHDPGLPFEVRGPQGVAQLHDALLPAFPDMVLPLEDFVAEGDKVLVRLRVQATHTGAFGDMAATDEVKSAFGVFSKKAGDVTSEFYLVDHTALTFLIGADGAFEGTIAYEESQDTAIAKVARLVKG